MSATLLSLLCLVVVSFGSAEPNCGKFHYDEQILEKLVRMEFEVEKIVNENKQMVTEMKKELAELRTEREEMKTELGEKQTDVLEVQNQLKLAVEEMNTTLLRGTELSTIPLVAFLARNPTDASPATGQTIVFGTIVQNEGAGYDSTTGVFTAPHKGLYSFSLHVCAYSASLFYYGIVKENVYLVRGLAYESGGSFPCRSATVFTTLNVGDKVWMKCAHQGGTRTLHLNDVNYWNSFAGVLIHT